jgi:hypothetical protein
MTNLTDGSQKQNRLEMIRQALNYKAPMTYKELESTGQLQKFLEAHDSEMMASYNEAKNEVWEKTMANFLDFADPPSMDESSLPMG